MQQDNPVVKPVMTDTRPTRVSKHVPCVFLRIFHGLVCRVHVSMVVSVQHSLLTYTKV